MKIVYNKFLPVKGFTAMAFFGVILARREFEPLTDKTVRHEQIHTAQAKELGGWILFYLAYLFLWIEYGYRNHPMEIEAYANDFKRDYLKNRIEFNWKNYRL